MRAKKKSGFSLIELLIVMVILGIILKIALPAYTTHVKRARRADAIQTLLTLQLAEENYRSSNLNYGTLAQAWGGVSTTANGYYTVAISNVAATTYTLTATALSTQTSDTENGTACSSLVVTYSAGVSTNTPAACWLTK